MASLTRVVQHGVDTAFRALGDLVKPGVWMKLTTNANQQIDFDGGVPMRVTTDYPLKRTVRVKFKIEDVDGKEVTTKDYKLLAPRQDLPVEPEQDDIFKDNKGVEWIVKRVLNDPADAIIIAQVRTA